jgi:hypothetical protein
MNKYNLKIERAVLDAVKRISAAAFDKRLGDDYSLCFTVTEQIKCISMYMTKHGKHVECFKCEFIGLNAGWLSSFPKTFNDIPEFEREVTAGLSDIFKYIEANNE